MSNLQLNQSIASTIAFYDAVGEVPLTKIELYKYLLRTQIEQASLSLADFFEYLENNWQELSRYITKQKGFYFLKKNSAGYSRRIHGGKSGVKKWRRAKNMAKIISLFPSVHMIGLTGSLALNNTHEKSDIDMLIVARAGSIWTTRILVSLAMHLLGKRRHGAKIADRICLNHYITGDGLAVRPRNLFSAHISATLVPLFDRKNIAHRLLGENAQLIDLHFPNFFTSPRLFHLKTLARKKTSPDGLYSSFLENIAKFLQVRKIKQSLSAKNGSDAEIIFDDRALVFHHPRPKDQEAIYLYEKNLKNLFTRYPHAST